MTYLSTSLAAGLRREVGLWWNDAKENVLMMASMDRALCVRAGQAGGVLVQPSGGLENVEGGCDRERRTA